MHRRTILGVLIGFAAGVGIGVATLLVVGVPAAIFTTAAGVSILVASGGLIGFDMDRRAKVIEEQLLQNRLQQPDHQPDIELQELAAAQQVEPVAEDVSVANPLINNAQPAINDGVPGTGVSNVRATRSSSDDQSRER